MQTKGIDLDVEKEENRPKSDQRETLQEETLQIDQDCDREQSGEKTEKENNSETKEDTNEPQKGLQEQTDSNEKSETKTSTESEEKITKEPEEGTEKTEVDTATGPNDEIDNLTTEEASDKTSTDAKNRVEESTEELATKSDAEKLAQNQSTKSGSEGADGVKREELPNEVESVNDKHAKTQQSPDETKQSTEKKEIEPKENEKQ